MAFTLVLTACGKSQSQMGIKSDDHFLSWFMILQKILSGDEGTVDLLIERDQSLMNMNCLLRGGL